MGLVLLVSVPVLAYKMVPSFYNKINYAKYELWMQRQGEAHDQLSDAGRLLSWRIGYDIWQAHPWLGVGPGNLKQEVMAVYAEDYPGVTRKRMPHNQFLSVAAGSGIVGLLVFLFALWPDGAAAAPDHAPRLSPDATTPSLGSSGHAAGAVR